MYIGKIVMNVKTIIKKVHEKGFKGCIKSLRIRSANLINKEIINYWKRQPIDKRLIVMESGGEITDNAYALYDYMGRNGYLKKYHVVWLVYEITGPKKEHKIQHLYPNTKIVWGDTTGIHKEWDRYLATCKWHIYDHTNFLRFYKKRKEQIIINLWHGCAFKRMKEVPVKEISPANINFMTGKIFTPVFTDAFSCKPNKLLDIGYPRNDYLFQANSVSIKHVKEKIGLTQFNKVFLWMPTFRRSVSAYLDESYFDSRTGLPVIEDEKSLEEFNDFLKQIHSLLIFKIHHLQASLKSFSHNYSNIILLHDEDIQGLNLQLYQIIPIADALITDYSSIAFDYMLLDRPIIFTVDDYEEYRDSRGFIPRDPIKYFAGDHVKDKHQLFDAVQRISNGEDNYKEQRHELLPLVHTHPDGNSSKRIVEYLNL